MGSRRAILAGTCAAGLLAACGKDNEHPAAAPTTAAATESPKPEALAATGDIPVGGGKVVDGVLVVQPVAGTFKAYNAACPHKGVLVDAPSNGIATCPAHKSTFSIIDGHHISGPAPDGLSPVAITVDGTQLRKA